MAAAKASLKPSAKTKMTANTIKSFIFSTSFRTKCMKGDLLITRIACDIFDLITQFAHLCGGDLDKLSAHLKNTDVQLEEQFIIVRDHMKAIGVFDI